MRILPPPLVFLLGKQTEIVSCQFFENAAQQQQQQKVRTILNTKCQQLVSSYLDILMNTCLSIHLYRMKYINNSNTAQRHKKKVQTPRGK